MPFGQDLVLKIMHELGGKATVKDLQANGIPYPGHLLRKLYMDRRVGRRRVNPASKGGNPLIYYILD